MAKKKSSKNRSSGVSSPQSTPSRRLLDQKQIHAILKSPTLKILSDRLRKIEDRRTYHPSGPMRSARSFNKAHHRLVVKASRPGRKPKAASSFPPAKVQFHDPKKVLVCVRRQTRREVIFATKRRGKGSSARRKHNWFSDVSC